MTASGSLRAGSLDRPKITHRYSGGNFSLTDVYGNVVTEI
jgi:hypothetical protein